MNKILVLRFRLNKKSGTYSFKWSPYDELPTLKEGDVYQILLDEENTIYETHMIQNDLDIIIDTSKHSLLEYIEDKIDMLEEEYKNNK